MPHLHGRPTLGGVAHAQECLVQRADQPLGCPTLGEALPAYRDALRWAIPCPQGLPAYRDAPSTGMTRPLLCSASGKLHPWGLPAYRDALPWGMSHPHGLPAYRDGWMSREDWPLGRRGPEGGRISLQGHAAPRWRLVLAWGWCSSRRTAVAALRVAPGLGCTPKKWQRRGPASRLPRPGAAASPAMGGPPPGSMTLRGPAAPMAPVSFRPGGPQTRHSPRGSPRSRAVLPPPLS